MFPAIVRVGEDVKAGVVYRLYCTGTQGRANDYIVEDTALKDRPREA
jgi:hypothetical protein